MRFQPNGDETAPGIVIEDDRTVDVALNTGFSFSFKTQRVRFTDFSRALLLVNDASLLEVRIALPGQRATANACAILPKW